MENIFAQSNLVDIFSIRGTCGNPGNIWKKTFFR